MEKSYFIKIGITLGVQIIPPATMVVHSRNKLVLQIAGAAIEETEAENRQEQQQEEESFVVSIT